MLKSTSAVDTFWRFPNNLPPLQRKAVTDAITQALVKSTEPPIFRALQTPDHQRSPCDHHGPQASGELSAKQAGCHLSKANYSLPRPQAAHAKRHQQIFPQWLLLHQHPNACTDRAAAICMRRLWTWSLCKLSVLCLSLMINWAKGLPSAQDFLWLRYFAASHKLKYISCPADTVYSWEQFLLDL